jgi:hypothetical protein
VSLSRYYFISTAVLTTNVQVRQESHRISTAKRIAVELPPRFGEAGKRSGSNTSSIT